MTCRAYGPNVVTTLYVNQPLNLPPLTAAAAFDAVREAFALPRAPDQWAIETASGQLRVLGTGVANRPGLYLLRQVPGRLRRQAGPRSMPVEVELTQWSRRRCEIGIRPNGRLAPVDDGWRQQRYLTLAVEAAEELALRLEAVVDGWLFGQLVAPERSLAKYNKTSTP